MNLIYLNDINLKKTTIKHYLHSIIIRFGDKVRLATENERLRKRVEDLESKLRRTEGYWTEDGLKFHLEEAKQNKREVEGRSH